MYGQKDECVWMNGYMYGWMGICMDEWVYVRTNGIHMDEWVYVWMNGYMWGEMVFIWMNGYMYGWMGICMDEWIIDTYYEIIHPSIAWGYIYITSSMIYIICWHSFIFYQCGVFTIILLTHHSPTHNPFPQ